MRYGSTRGQAPDAGFTDVLLEGLAPDGGLYHPQAWPDLAPSVLDPGCAYVVRAEAVLHGFAGSEDPLAEHLHSACQAAYARFQSPAVTPLVQIDADLWLLELFHGPTLAFKDIALQLMAQLYDQALARAGRRLTVLVATSGDTGGAAAAALAGLANIDLFILLPEGRVSDVQRRFMTTTGAENVHALSVSGDFDDCQRLVKAAFAEEAFRRDYDLSGVNSINWVRIAAQSVYFLAAGAALPGPAAFYAPTGNFGDCLAGWVAGRLGLEIDSLTAAVNANDALAQFVSHGMARRQAALATLSPAMDINVASNLERLVFEAFDRDGAATARAYEGFADTGRLSVPSAAHAKLAAAIRAVSVDDGRTIAEMARVHAETGQLIDPHTAVGVAAARDRPPKTPGAPRVVLATAHPAKFPDAVHEATGRHPQAPERCGDLFERPEKLSPLTADLQALKTQVAERAPRP
ncbi:MAG: threonine synthase [Maricaulaceae bacterium]